ncbi:VRR-NUC domain-containing protein [Croceicoccus hydrothermalis]|uniref:VRR-NUC domain-containing protein n=1 Tax=Croceicoccus hydrothermalis TaxID=2867964 RepID=UPI001EFB6E6D|nr:VRR-NUC domain-containing protein [Croceicoccus hydrothermalis]
MTGFFERLFGKRAPDQAGQVARSKERLEIDEFAHGLVSIPQLDFVGHQARSPNRRFRLIWTDRTPDGLRGGNRESGHGSWSLLFDESIVKSGKLERPQEGKVADNGTFILHDWMFGHGLHGRFVACDSQGQTLIAQQFSANLMSNGLSPDGRYAICQTANAPGSDDSCRYMLFDLEAGREIARWEVETGWADGYNWDCDAGRVVICLKDGEQAIYDLTGTMVDREGWRRRRIAAGDLGVIKDVLSSLAPLDREMRQDIAAGLRRAVREGEIWSQARAFRLLGELHETEGEPEKAIKAYDDALRLDPKVGVARRVEKLRKETGQQEVKRARGRQSRFEKQAERLGIGHDVIMLDKGTGKDWRLHTVHDWSLVEFAALEHYLEQGWSGAASEGGLILTLIKAASFPRLDPRHADTFVEALYAQNVAFAQDKFAKDQLLASVSRATRSQIEDNWKIISASAGDTPAFYPSVRAEHVFGLFEALGSDRLAEIANVFATAPYDLRSGWPDLTLWKGKTVRFVEVKAPSDSFHASQARLISQLLLPLGFDVCLGEVRPTT